MDGGFHLNMDDAASNYARMNESERQRVRRKVLSDPANQESMEDMRERLRLMKTIVDDTRDVMSVTTSSPPKQRGIPVDGAMMGAVFVVILAVILGASVHAFKTLYHAIMKRFNLS